ncbi:hypothetical protein M0802_015332 [Mischocyttarus mexicanus]|nr:hypothetical protein M0802_015332 [Mischocyttarus mexicanus]
MRSNALRMVFQRGTDKRLVEKKGWVDREGNEDEEDEEDEKTERDTAPATVTTTATAAPAAITSLEKRRRNELKEFTASYFDPLLDSLGLERTLTSIKERYIFICTE